MLHASESSAVVLVDLQARLMPVIHEGTLVVSKAVRLGKIAQVLGVPVLGTEQTPRHLGKNDETMSSVS